MNLILLLIIGFLVFLATYMILSLNLIRIIVGISIYTHAGNLIIMSMGHYSDHVTEPLIRGSNTNYVDPLLQALVLTAIVIDWYDSFLTCISLSNISCYKRIRN